MSMKEHREAATSGMRAKLARMGGKMGDKKHLERGGKCYAGGGAVGASDMAMGAVDGMPSKPSVSKPAKHKGKGKSKGKGDTHVNVVVMPKGGPDMPMPPGGAMPPPHPMPPPMPPPGPPMGGPPGGPPGMPPPGGPPMGPGGPPMMHAAGGRVGRATGGKVRGVKDGAGGGKGRMEKMKMYGEKAGKSTGYNK